MNTEKFSGTFSIDDLMALLIAKAGLPAEGRPADPQWTFADVGLDSLAFLQLQAELHGLYGVQLPTDQAQSYTFGQIVTHVNSEIGSAA